MLHATVAVDGVNTGDLVPVAFRAGVFAVTQWLSRETLPPVDNFFGITGIEAGVPVSVEAASALATASTATISTRLAAPGAAAAVVRGVEGDAELSTEHQIALTPGIGFDVGIAVGVDIAVHIAVNVSIKVGVGVDIAVYIAVNVTINIGIGIGIGVAIDIGVPITVR